MSGAVVVEAGSSVTCSRVVHTKLRLPPGCGDQRGQLIAGKDFVYELIEMGETFLSAGASLRK